MSTVAIIPARGGSKGIPRKNLVTFCGEPLLYWTVKAALNCRAVDAVYVSTDDDEIARYARELSANVIDRPEEYARDSSTSESALIHACRELEKSTSQLPTRVVFLQATSPLRDSDELSAALAYCDAAGLDSLFCAAEGEDFLWWRETPEGGLNSLNYDFRSRKRRQEQSGDGRILLETGSFYITRTSVLLESGNRLGGKIGYFLVPFWKSFEIDSLEGLQLCEILMRQHGVDVRLKREGLKH